MDRSDPFSSKFISSAESSEHLTRRNILVEMHSGCSIHAVGSILICLGLSISADGNLLGVRKSTRFSMLITQ